MTYDFTGPSPEKRLQDCVLLVRTYMRAQDIVDTARYPHCAAHGGWCDDDFEDALQGLYECALSKHRDYECRRIYNMDSASMSLTVGRVIDALTKAFVDGLAPSVDDHRLIVVTLANHWPDGWQVSKPVIHLHRTWPISVITPDAQDFQHQTTKAEARWQSRQERLVMRTQSEVPKAGWYDQQAAAAMVLHRRHATA